MCRKLPNATFNAKKYTFTKDPCILGYSRAKLCYEVQIGPVKYFISQKTIKKIHPPNTTVKTGTYEYNFLTCFEHFKYKLLNT